MKVKVSRVRQYLDDADLDQLRDAAVVLWEAFLASREQVTHMILDACDQCSRARAMTDSSQSCEHYRELQVAISAGFDLGRGDPA